MAEAENCPPYILSAETIIDIVVYAKMRIIIKELNCLVQKKKRIYVFGCFWKQNNKFMCLGAFGNRINHVDENI